MRSIPGFESQFHRTQRTPAAGRSCRPEAGALRGRALSVLSKVGEIFVMATKNPAALAAGQVVLVFARKHHPYGLLWASSSPSESRERRIMEGVIFEVGSQLYFDFTSGISEGQAEAGEIREEYGTRFSIPRCCFAN